MMINLFSTFDPSTTPNMSLNWISLALPISLIPMFLWTNNSQHQMPMSLMSKFINKEISSMKISMYNGMPIILFSLMWYLMISNSMGLLPYIFTSTSNLCISSTLALTLWLSMNMFSWMWKTSNMFTHMLPLGTPSPLMVFMVCIETTSNIIRPLTLAIRLSANMIAGHLLISLLSNLLMKTSTIMLMPLLVSELMLLTLESAVAIIQSYVFMTLLLLYLDEMNH